MIISARSNGSFISFQRLDAEPGTWVPGGNSGHGDAVYIH